MDKGSSLNTGHLIEKSKALVWAKFKDWDAAELRLLEVYLSRIDARKPESSNVRFTLKEYADLLGVSDLRHDQIQAHTRRFMGNVVTLKHGSDEWDIYTLFSVARCYKDTDLNQYVIEIDCNPQMKDVFFSLAQDGYIKYRLRNTVKMSSEYSVQLYSLLLDMMHIKGGWQINLKTLKEQLGATSKGYDEFKNFRRRVLDTAIAEINEVSDITASYTRIMTGRTCTAVRFTAEYKLSPQSKPKPNEKSLYAAAMPELNESQAIRIGEMVKRQAKANYPELTESQLENATVDILKNAYKDLIENRAEFPDNPGGYIWSVLSKPTALDEYIPVSYLF